MWFESKINNAGKCNTHLEETFSELTKNMQNCCQYVLWSIYKDFPLTKLNVIPFNPIQARGSLGIPPKFSDYDPQNFWDNFLKFGNFS